MAKRLVFDGIRLKVLLQCGQRVGKWLAFHSHILRTENHPKDLKKTKVITALRPGKGNTVK